MQGYILVSWYFLSCYIIKEIPKLWGIGLWVVFSSLTYSFSWKSFLSHRRYICTGPSPSYSSRLHTPLSATSLDLHSGCSGLQITHSPSQCLAFMFQEIACLPPLNVYICLFFEPSQNLPHLESVLFMTLKTYK